MDKAIVIGLVAALLLGAVFVSAQFSTSDVVEVTEPEVQPSCGAGACNFECGGNCAAAPKCGCGR